MFDHLWLSLATDWFIDEEHLNKFVDVARDLYSIVGANSGYIQNWRNERSLEEITDDEGNLIGGRPPKVKWALPGIFWANFFGPEYVDMFGSNKLVSAPWHKTDDLPDGGVLAFLSKSPIDASKPEYQARKKEMYGYLGEDAFTGILMPKFRTEGRKKRDARPLVRSRGVHDDVFRSIVKTKHSTTDASYSQTREGTVASLDENGLSPHQ